MKHFIKVREDFACQNCGEMVEGSGYTNHCTKCLYSLHVDGEVPGDRSSNCRGLMKPIGIDKKRGNFVITHECVVCGKRLKNKVSEKDDYELILKLASGAS
jgi:hypothetical protein